MDPELSAEVHDLLLDRGGRGRYLQHHRATAWRRCCLGIADVAGKYYIPKLGAFIVYSLMIIILVWRPQGLFVRKGGKA